VSTATKNININIAQLLYYFQSQSENVMCREITVFTVHSRY